MLLTRDIFRESVFKRDNYLCVFCKEKAVDAHHIMERRLFNDGGYYLDNGISVCAECHLFCEDTTISPKEARKAANITKVILPEHLYSDIEYDKWGNPYLENKKRARGELFYDESVQKIIKPYLNEFVKYVKYPRTYHAPWSVAGKDDKTIKDMSSFYGRYIVITEKMDGENTTLYNDYYHARSLDSRNHQSRNYAKALHAKIAHEIPENYRLCCENMYAKHSIKYDNLKSYLYGLSVWDGNKCLSWSETVDFFTLLDFPTPNILYIGIYDDSHIKNITKNINTKICEGYVIRLANEFSLRDFSKSVVKWVRPNHISSLQHWSTTRIEKNLLLSSV